MAAPNKTKAILSLIFGIVCLFGGWFGFIPVIGAILPTFALAFAIVAVILGAKARKGTEGKGMATAGLIMGIIGLVIGGVGFICGLCGICTLCTAGCSAAELGGAGMLDEILGSL